MVESWPLSERRCEECEHTEKEAGAKGAICLRCRNVEAGKRYGWSVGTLGQRNYAPAWCPRQKRGERREERTQSDGDSSPVMRQPGHKPGRKKKG